jgi:hypothetical protein
VSVPHTGERPLDGRLPGDGLLGLLHLLIDAVQGPPGPVGLVLAVDDLVLAIRLGPGGPQLGEHVPVRDLLIRMLAARPGDRLARQGLKAAAAAVSVSPPLCSTAQEPAIFSSAAEASSRASSA